MFLSPCTAIELITCFVYRAFKFSFMIWFIRPHKPITPAQRDQRLQEKVFQYKFAVISHQFSFFFMYLFRFSLDMKTLKKYNTEKIILEWNKMDVIASKLLQFFNYLLSLFVYILFRKNLLKVVQFKLKLINWLIGWMEYLFGL